MLRVCSPLRLSCGDQREDIRQTIKRFRAEYRSVSVMGMLRQSSMSQSGLIPTRCIDSSEQAAHRKPDQQPRNDVNRAPMRRIVAEQFPFEVLPDGGKYEHPKSPLKHAEPQDVLRSVQVLIPMVESPQTKCKRYTDGARNRRNYQSSP